MSRKWMITLSVALAVSMLGTGCIGRFALSGKVREFNLSASKDRWGREIIFLALYIIPVYPFAGFIDILIINSIEFWTGKNPVNGEPSVTPLSRTEELPDGSKLAMTLRDDGSIDVEVETAAGQRHFMNLVREGGQVVARDASGKVVATAREAERALSARGALGAEVYSRWMSRGGLRAALEPVPHG